MSISAWGLAVPFGHDPNQMTVMPSPRTCLANRATSSAISFGWSLRACWSMGSVYWFSRRSQPRVVQRKGDKQDILDFQVRACPAPCLASSHRSES